MSDTASAYRDLAAAALAVDPIAAHVRKGRTVDLRHGAGKTRHSLGIALRPSLSAGGGIALAVEYLDGLTTGNTVTAASTSPEYLDCATCRTAPGETWPLDLLRIALRAYGVGGSERRDGRRYWGLVDSPGN